MAKEKKRGFFSWLGFGQKEQDQVVESEDKIEEQPAVESSVVKRMLTRIRLKKVKFSPLMWLMSLSR